MSKATNDDRTPAGVTRRDFLTGMTVAGGAAALGVSVQVHSARSGAPETEKPPAQGYRETRHVLDYYRSARL